MTNVFYSYSHKDENMRNALDKHLSVLKRNHLIDSWHDRRIDAGSEVYRTISENLKKANIILLLVSADFLASDYCYDIEMKEAMAKHERGEAKVIPIILRPCDWHDAPFGNLLALPTDGKPVSKYLHIDDAFLEITNGIKTVIIGRTTRNAMPEPKGENAISMSSMRSTNLTIVKTFSDHDKDKFLRESFLYIANYFKGSLEELEMKNPEISFLFDQIDSQTFTTIIYKDGKKVCECMIYIGSMLSPNSINYSHQISLTKNMLNETLNIVSNGHMLLLKPMGMSMFKGIGDGEMSQGGGAEFYWHLLINSLQRR
jgi:TIR domain